MRLFADRPGSRGGATDGDQKLLEALAQDPEGIGYSGLLYRHPDVRPLAFVGQRQRSRGDADARQRRRRSYPRWRGRSFVFLDRQPGQPGGPVSKFLHYVSAASRQAVLQTTVPGYRRRAAAFLPTFTTRRRVRPAAGRGNTGRRRAIRHAEKKRRR